MTLVIIIITAVISYLAFKNHELFDKLKFNAYFIKQSNEWYRFFSYGLIHADWMHLIVNLFVLYLFGDIVEQKFKEFYGIKSNLYYILLYVGGIGFSVIISYRRHKENVVYNAVGASGAVSAIVFSSILLQPTGSIMFVFFPIPIPAPVFGVIYLIYSAYMDKKASDNIGHNVHFLGAIYGLAYTIAIRPQLVPEFLKAIGI